MQTLPDGLPPEAQAKLLPGKKLTDISSGPDGVSVTCADSTSHAGSVLVGADGAYSQVRDLMRTAAVQTLATTEDEVNEAAPLVTTRGGSKSPSPPSVPQDGGDTD